MKNTEKFTVRNFFEIKKNDEAFCDVSVNFYNVERDGMLMMEDFIVDYINRLNNIEKVEK